MGRGGGVTARVAIALAAAALCCCCGGVGMAAAEASADDRMQSGAGGGAAAAADHQGAGSSSSVVVADGGAALPATEAGTFRICLLSPVNASRAWVFQAMAGLLVRRRIRRSLMPPAVVRRSASPCETGKISGAS